MQYNKYMRWWLITGCVLVFFQIVIGGVTRITGSGLSITKWEIVTGTLPPLTDTAWEDAFDLYKETPQYKKINQGMSMSAFKFIYFWEFLHRFWARMMGFIFLFPFLFFIRKRWIDNWMIKQLCWVIFWAMMAAVFGWIMVASGLVERPWVNAYKLSLHLGIALATYSFLIWATFRSFGLEKLAVTNSYFNRQAKNFLFCLLVQLFFGAVLSGMRAALYYPSWPDMNGSFFPEVLLDFSSWSLESIVDYDKDALMPALIHVLHRTWGYIIYVFGMVLGYRMLRFPLRRAYYYGAVSLMILLNTQVILGILTLVNSEVEIPVLWGVLHQAVAIFLLTNILYLVYIFKKRVV